MFGCNAYIDLRDDFVGDLLEIMMDKSWIHMHRTSPEYRKGVESFLEFAFRNAGGSKLIVCPCNKCKVGHNRCFTKEEVAHHLMFNGFWPYYKEWVHHGEEISRHSSIFCDKGRNNTNTQSESGFGNIDTMRILNDIFGWHENCGNDMFHQEGDMDEDDNGELGNEWHEGDSSNVDKDAGYERLLEQVE